ncbi:NAD-dependent epimerase/dehydratase family protein [Spirillospora sp. NPDC046719]
MSAQILLTGGTGTLGGHVLPLLRDAGRDVRVLSRRPHAPRETTRRPATSPGPPRARACATSS